MRVLWDYLSKADKQYLLAQVPLIDFYKELHRRAQEPDEEEEEGEEEELFYFKHLTERQYAFYRLASKYPHEVANLVARGEREAPKWLQKEILEVRKGGL